ncbi:MAG: hydrogenase iron-sulfur subunit [Lentisphaerae bacterium]|nr:hydrogenase iron-sulfur subunit [Lentisphaerota bacterium]
MSKIVAFCCENSGHKVVESLGLSMPSNVDIRKIPCTGRLEIAQMLAEIEQGAEKVLVLACPLDNCKYVRGNQRAAKRVAAAKNALRDAGLSEDMIRIEFMSSLDKHKLKAVFVEMGVI